ncbi:hypothetical protein COU15_02570 [Candidatus Kaiserbacteria bacterium CG10_big_fil_rev_8_21_14_0_10_45_20]|uniref:Thioredoxin domain-containing protein n=1 Tax=Candidatus Kaiserbacteria bacterium CG10_big_fil_rev_8_21_14_0_10_45_20 TaxID=1974607 RepID=A0A2H0UFB7_9BACT|nr:MAG: hypothetical protein COU15_02570 [Candidatus Kaiserbacteria bacterium CG10_big_fil_rev_8_21_14_0_10_45_20]
MKIKKNTYIWIGVFALLIIVPFGLFLYNQSTPGKLDAFAQCLGEKDAVFYGAFWCPHCQTQKSFFGKSSKELPYVECSTPDGQGRTQECIAKEINTYPTWEFADGERLLGEQSLATLAEKTGCELPAE